MFDYFAVFSFCVLKCLVAHIALLKVKVRFPSTRHEGVWLSGGLAPLFLNLGTKWDEQSPLHPGNNPSVPVE